MNRPAKPFQRLLPRGSRALRWGVPLLGLLIIGAMWLLVLVSMDNERQRTERDALARASALARAYMENVERSLEQLEQLTGFVAHIHEQEGSKLDLAALIGAQLDRTPGLSILTIADEHGNLIASSQASPPRGNLSERPYFQLHRNHAQPVVRLSEPVLGRLSQRQVIIFSRRLSKPDGSFAGIVAISADPSYFAAFYSHVALGAQGMLTLSSLDGGLRAQRVGDQVWYEGTGPQPPDALTSVALQRGFDGRMRYQAWQRLERYPLVVSAGLDQEEVLADHRDRRLALFGFFGGATVLLLFAFGTLGQLVRRLRRSQTEATQARRKLEAAANASLDAFFILTALRGADGGIEGFAVGHCNTHGEAILRQHALGQLAAGQEPLRREMGPAYYDLYVQVVTTRQPVEAEFPILPPGSDVEQVLHFQIVPVDDGCAVTVRDMTTVRAQEAAVRAAQDALRASEERVRGITDNLPALISYIDPQERLQFVNATFRTWLGVEPEQAVGRTLAEVVGEDLYRSRADMLQKALAGKRVEFDGVAMVRGKQRDAHTIYVPDQAGDGSVRGVYALSMDISRLKQVERQLADLARVDALTGLPNRLAINESLPVMLARAGRAGTGLALMYLDIDRFKAINDTLGHAAGDAVLAEFARRLQSCVRSTDTVARLSGDEFVVVLEQLHAREVAAAMAQKIVDRVRDPSFPYQDRSLEVTTSIGVAFHAPGAPPVAAAELLARADAALYGAKAAGRSTYQFAI